MNRPPPHTFMVRRGSTVRVRQRALKAARSPDSGRHSLDEPHKTLQSPLLRKRQSSQSGRRRPRRPADRRRRDAGTSGRVGRPSTSRTQARRRPPQRAASRAGARARATTAPAECRGGLSRVQLTLRETPLDAQPSVAEVDVRLRQRHANDLLLAQRTSLLNRSRCDGPPETHPGRRVRPNQSLFVGRREQCLHRGDPQADRVPGPHLRPRHYGLTIRALTLRRSAVPGPPTGYVRWPIGLVLPHTLPQYYERWHQTRRTRASLAWLSDAGGGT